MSLANNCIMPPTRWRHHTAAFFLGVVRFWGFVPSVSLSGGEMNVSVRPSSFLPSFWVIVLHNYILHNAFLWNLTNIIFSKFILLLRPRVALSIKIIVRPSRGSHASLSPDSSSLECFVHLDYEPFLLHIYPFYHIGRGLAQFQILCGSSLFFFFLENFDLALWLVLLRSGLTLVVWPLFHSVWTIDCDTFIAQPFGNSWWWHGLFRVFLHTVFMLFFFVFSCFDFPWLIHSVSGCWYTSVSLLFGTFRLVISFIFWSQTQLSSMHSKGLALLFQYLQRGLFCT